MKKVMLFIMLFAVGGLACEKVADDYCWRCHTYYYDRIYFPDGEVFEKRHTDSLDLCGYSERDIQKYERYHTMPKYSISTCGDHIRWQDCLCVRNEY